MAVGTIHGRRNQGGSGSLSPPDFLKQRAELPKNSKGIAHVVRERENSLGKILADPSSGNLYLRCLSSSPHNFNYLSTALKPSASSSEEPQNLKNFYKVRVTEEST